MHNMGIVVESLDNAISFFTEIGLKLEGRAMVDGAWKPVSRDCYDGYPRWTQPT